MNNYEIYHSEIPAFLKEFANTTPMQRLKQIGMNCGVEYTSLSLFKDIDSYSRFDHSLGVALIVYHFTGDEKQALAALFHDISTPVFAHTIDFLHNDHEKQESTEQPTEQIIRQSAPIRTLLDKYKIKVDDVINYQVYPIADNKAPRLAADRLEYTLGNIVNFKFGTKQDIKTYYDDLSIGINENQEPELVFKHPAIAKEFTFKMLQCARVYQSKEDRYAMQSLACLMAQAIKLNVLKEDDLMLDESYVISKLQTNNLTKTKWQEYQSLNKVSYCNEGLVIPAKKRFIDPLILNSTRLSHLDEEVNKAIKDFLSDDFSLPLKGNITI